ncbi:MAG: dihydrofolate synthase, partial [Gaiellaceae bacterium]
MRFGLERMRRLMTVLHHPERRFASIHVVGTNGKSSTVRMIAGILAHHDLRVGSYLSPHLTSFGERIRIGDRDLPPDRFGAAIGRAARAAQLVDRSADADDR